MARKDMAMSIHVRRGSGCALGVCVAAHTVGREASRGSFSQERTSVQDSMVLSEAEQKEGLPECVFWRCVAVDAQVIPALNLFEHHVRRADRLEATLIRTKNVGILWHGAFQAGQKGENIAKVLPDYLILKVIRDSGAPVLIHQGANTHLHQAEDVVMKL